MRLIFILFLFQSVFGEGWNMRYVRHPLTDEVYKIIETRSGMPNEYLVFQKKDGVISGYISIKPVLIHDRNTINVAFRIDNFPPESFLPWAIMPQKDIIIIHPNHFKLLVVSLRRSSFIYFVLNLEGEISKYYSFNTINFDLAWKWLNE
jgi:hypothetical protein